MPNSEDEKKSSNCLNELNDAQSKANLEQNGYFNKIRNEQPNGYLDGTLTRKEKRQPKIALNESKELKSQLPSIHLLANHRKQLNKQEEDDDNNSVFLSAEKSKLVLNQLKNHNLVYKKVKKKSNSTSSPKNKIISLQNPNFIHHRHHSNPVSLSNHHLNTHLNKLNSGQFILTEHSITVMEESTSDEEKHTEPFFDDLNRITINSQENRYQYLHHQHFHHHANDKLLNEEHQLITATPTIVQPTNTALFALQRKQLQYQQIQQRKEQGAKLIRNRSTSDALNGLAFVLSAIYAKLVVILGLCFPMAEVISHRIPIGWYEGFYLYLYLGSIFFLCTIYMCRESSKHKINTFSKIKKFLFWSNLDQDKKPTKSLVHENSFASNCTLGASGNLSIHSSCSESDSFLDHNKSAHYGSFYLRLGAVAFGIGSMIYSGLEFGQFFELENKGKSDFEI